MECSRSHCKNYCKIKEILQTSKTPTTMIKEPKAVFLQ